MAEFLASVEGEDTIEFEFDDSKLNDVLDFTDNPEALKEKEAEEKGIAEEVYKAPKSSDFIFEEGKDTFEPEEVDYTGEGDDGESEEEGGTEINEEEIEATSGNEEISEDAEIEALFISRLAETTGFSITPEELEEGDLEDIVAAKKMGYANEVLQNHISQFGDQEQQAIAALLQGATLDSLVDSNTTPQLNFTKDDLEDDIELQRKVIQDLQRAKGRSEKEIKRYMRGIEEDELLEEATESYDEMGNIYKNQDKERLERSRKEAEELQRQREEATRQIITASDEFFADTKKFLPGVTMRKDTKEAIKAKIFDTYNEINQDLSKYLPRIAMLKHLGVLDGDISKLTKEVKSQSADAYAKILKTRRPAPGTVTKKRDVNEYRPVAPYSSKR